MTITYNLAPEHKRRYVYPASYGEGIAGTPIVGGKIYTYESIAHTTEKATYSSNIGSPPPLNTNPVILDDSGECVIYWAYDDTNPDDNFYYVELRDPNNVLIDSYGVYNGVPFPAGSGTSASDSNNFIRNSQFAFNRFKSTYKLKNASATVVTGTYVGDDWLFTKNNNSVDESITITPFTVGQTEVPFNPAAYLDWTVTTGGGSETFKNIYQYYNGVQTFSGQQLILQIRAKSNTSASIPVNFRQYFGSGGSPTSDVVTLIGTLNLNPNFTLYTIAFTPPSTADSEIGTNGDDRVQIEFSLPLNASLGTNFGFTNAALNPGTVVPGFPLQTYQQMQNALQKDWFDTPTGVERFTVIAKQASSMPGWIPLDDGTIGNFLSSATTFASEDAFALYSLIWANTTQANCPVYPNGAGATATPTIVGNTVDSIAVNTGGNNYGTATSVLITGGGGSGATATCTVVDGIITVVTMVTKGTGYSGTPSVSFVDPGRGATALDDFNANKTINLPFTQNRLQGNTGPSIMGSGAVATGTQTGGVITTVPLSNGGTGYSSATYVTVSGSGGGSGAVIIPEIINGIIRNLIIQSGGTSYSGTITVTITDPGLSANALGSYTGKEKTKEIVNHTHAYNEATLPPGTEVSNASNAYNLIYVQEQTNTPTSGSGGGAIPVNEMSLMNPSSFFNNFIKL